jgi:hypothetical protein
MNNLDMEIENRAITLDGSYARAVIEYCEEKNIYDYEDVTDQLSDILFNKIKTEFKMKGFIRNEKHKNQVDNTFFE